MKATILDNRNDGNGTCYLCKITLENYINGLPSTYQDYDIQREIVTNVYLDALVDTVLLQRHIPPIVLVVQKNQFKQTASEAEIVTFKILDGLQRTFRLQAIRKTFEFCVNELDKKEDYLKWNKFKLSRAFSKSLQKIESNTNVLLSVLTFQKKNGDDVLLDVFKKNYQWFEIWTGLSGQDEVRKMLTLNAGHKPVKTRHQLELLFLNLLPILRGDQAKNFKLVREKDISSTQFSKGRECGSFHFAHIVTSLLSFYEEEPIAPTTGLIQSIQGNDIGIEEYRDLTSPDFLKTFVAFLVQLDETLTEQYPEIGVYWMGREISLAGLFGGLGAYAAKVKEKRELVMKRFLNLVKTHPKILDLNQFEAERNNVDLSKVNIGNVNRMAVFGAVQELLVSPAPKKVDWNKHFGGEGK